MTHPSNPREFIETIVSEETPLPSESELDAETDEGMSALFALLGRKHAIAIVHQFVTTDESLRFRDLEEELAIAPTTLSRRLTELVDAELLDRTSYDEVPPRVEYEPTERARELAPVFWYLAIWTDRHSITAGDFP